MSAVEKAITEHLAQEFLQDRPDLVPLDSATNLIDEGVLDSLGIFVMISFLESEFGVDVEPDEVTMNNFGTVQAISDLVHAKQRAGLYHRDGE